MADIHVLTGDQNRSWSVVMHFNVPDATNEVGVNYRTALVTSGLGGSTALPDGDGTGGTISAAEKAEIEAGIKAEYSASVLVESGGTSPAEMRAMLRGEYARQNATAIANLQSRLRYFGHVEARA